MLTSELLAEFLAIWFKFSDLKYANYLKAFTTILTSFIVHAQKHYFYWNVLSHLLAQWDKHTESLVIRQREKSGINQKLKI